MLVSGCHLFVSLFYGDYEFGVFSFGNRWRHSSQKSFRSVLISFLNDNIPNRFGMVISAIVTPEKIQTMVVSVKAARKKPIT